MNIFKSAVLLLTLSMSVSANAATEFGEYCFSGSFVQEGNCVINLDFTQHTTNFSVNGNFSCDDLDKRLSGIASGSGYISGNFFQGALTVHLTEGYDQIRNVIFKINLDNLNTIFSKVTTIVPVCGEPVDGGLYKLCMENVVFKTISCE